MRSFSNISISDNSHANYKLPLTSNTEGHIAQSLETSFISIYPSTVIWSSTCNHFPCRYQPYEPYLFNASTRGRDTHSRFQKICFMSEAHLWCAESQQMIPMNLGVLFCVTNIIMSNPFVVTRKRSYPGQVAAGKMSMPYQVVCVYRSCSLYRCVWWPLSCWQQPSWQKSCLE